ncbi:Hint domain-containing protein [Nannocystis punicea]|uniref:Hint domain-containing protein n=1 Tax=Nannocystis punicea TaxID=2995304 RepID=A0ABY7H9Q2_9BACT|nr:Hint domain-containing protein [Nannocystis poenicansa]WAS95978.1 Hint domain-containing protein [Nannocystis poenicansa]
MRRATASVLLFSLVGCTPEVQLETPPAPVPTPQPPPPSPPPPAPPEPPALDDAMLTYPWIRGSVDRCALDIDVPLVPLAAPLVSLAVVAGEAEVRNLEPADCTSPVMFELPRELLAVAAPATNREPARLRVRIEPPLVACEKKYALGVCLRDQSGALHPSRNPNAPASAHPEVSVEETWHSGPRLLTPSGESGDYLAMRPGLQLIGADPTTGDRVRVDLRSRQERRSATMVELRLTTGERIDIPPKQELWRIDQATWVRASEVAAGDRLFGLDGPVEVREVQTNKRSYGVDVADVSAPDTYFIDRVLVRDGRPTRGEPTPLAPGEDPTQHPAVELVAASESYDCSLGTTLTVREWPAGAESIVLLAERHPGPPGARITLQCDPQHAFSSVPRTLWDAWQAQPATAGRPLTLALEAGEEGWAAEEPGFTGVVGCSSDVALLACGRAADGTLSPVTGAARWGHSGAVCFATGTPIDTPAGPVAIEALAPGATVLSFDVLRGEAQVAHVLRRASRGERPVLQIRLADGRALRVTGEHPLWLPRVGAFRPAQDLHVGDRLLGRDGAALPIESIVPDGTSEVWELSVDAPDTYFADGVLAHNY